MVIFRHSFTSSILGIVLLSYLLSSFKLNALDNLIIILILPVAYFYLKPLTLNKLNYYQLLLFYFLSLYFSISLFLLFTSPNDFNALNYIANAKIFLFYFLFLFSSKSYFTKTNLTYRSLFPLKTFLVLAIVAYLFVYNNDPSLVGERNDFGLAIVFLFFIVISLINHQFIQENRFKFIILFLFALFLVTFLLLALQGRTAFISFLIFTSIYSLMNFRKYRYMIVLFLSVPISAALFMLIELRGGFDYIFSQEARFLALLYFLDIFSELNFINLLFGHFVSSCADSIYPTLSGIYDPHVSQVIKSAGCYVSWGFHNQFLSLFYTFGFLPTFIFIFLIFKTCFFDSHILPLQEKYLSYFVGLFLFLGGFSNMLLFNDINGTLFWVCFGVIFGKIQYLKAIKKRGHRKQSMFN